MWEVTQRCIAVGLQARPAYQLGFPDPRMQRQRLWRKLPVVPWKHMGGWVKLPGFGISGGLLGRLVRQIPQQNLAW